MDRLRVGIIGCGYWGPNLVRNFVELPDADVVAVADLSAERLASIGARYPQIALTKDYADFFEMGLDAAVVATPPPTHFAIARDCLEHDLHTLIEKPMTLNSLDAERLVDLAEQRDLRLMVGHTFEYNPAVQALKQIIDRGELGRVYYIDAVRVNLGLFQNYLNVLWDLAPHDLSIIRYLLGAEPTHVQACGAACIFANIHDLAYLYLEFPEGLIAHVHVSWVDPCKVRRITIVGSQKMAVYDDVEPTEKIRIYDKGVEKPPYTHTLNEFHLSYRSGDVVIPCIRSTEPLRAECQHFVEAIRTRAVPNSSGRDGLQVVRILEAAQQSLVNGERTPVASDEERAHDYRPV